MTLKRYWGATPPIHIAENKKLLDKWKEFDAKLTPDDVLEMQRIDADCNDCVFFQRGSQQKVAGATVFYGHSLKLNIPTKAYPMQFTGHTCFVHRKDFTGVKPVLQPTQDAVSPATTEGEIL